MDKNRYILSKIIDCVKFCGAFELALRGHDETDSSDNPGIFRGLVDFVASLDNVLEEHLKTATVFLSVVKDYILEEVTAADFIAIKADETTDVSTRCQLVLVLCYIDSNGNIQECFFEFLTIHNANADSIATALLDRLRTILPNGQNKQSDCPNL